MTGEMKKRQISDRLLLAYHRLFGDGCSRKQQKSPSKPLGYDLNELGRVKRGKLAAYCVKPIAEEMRSAVSTTDEANSGTRVAGSSRCMAMTLMEATTVPV